MGKCKSLRNELKKNLLEYEKKENSFLQTNHETKGNYDTLAQPKLNTNQYENTPK